MPTFLSLFAPARVVAVPRAPYTPRSPYPEPFVPGKFACSIRKATTKVLVTDARSGKRIARSEPRWDVKGQANGISFSKRFARAGLAESWKRRLDEGYVAGLPFDVATKCFVAPTTAPSRAEPEAVTVFSLTEAFYRSHPEWEPKTKIIAATALNRARRWLLVPGAELSGSEMAAVDDYLAHGSFRRANDDSALTDSQAAGRDWLQAHSARASDVTTGQIEEFLARFETNQRNGKKVSRTTMIRYSQPLRACWSWAVKREDVPVLRDPWLAVKTPRKVKGKATRPAGGASRLAVDKNIVLDVAQVLELAEKCATVGSWGEIVRCYVLVMGLCGLRPNEAVGVTWEDVELPDDSSPGWITVRRSRRRVAARWLDPEEDPEWGPLKDRDIADSRRVPIHPLLVERLQVHRSLVGEGPDGLVFHRNGRPFDLSVFARIVWDPARAEMFPSRPDLPPDHPRQPKLSKLRRHDLRHAACSWWLRSGVDATVCQRWSGHKNLSVFLDVYQGVAPGREDEGVRKLVASVPADDTRRTTSRRSVGRV